MVSNPSRGTCAFGGTLHLAVQVGNEVSNPSRGTCAFGIARRPNEARSWCGLKPLSGNVCLRPKAGRRAPVPTGVSQTPLGERVPSAASMRPIVHALRRVSNPSRGTCAFGSTQSSGQQGCRCVSNPSRGTCAFGREHWAAEAKLLERLSQTPLGERVPSALPRPRARPRVGGVSNPSRGTCAFGKGHGGLRRLIAASQTPLGERVPSALWSPQGSSIAVRLKPLSGNVCLRPSRSWSAQRLGLKSQTPLGERVPSAVPLGQVRHRCGASQTPLGERVPSAIFGSMIERGAEPSQTPLGERVPSA